MHDVHVFLFSVHTLQFSSHKIHSVVESVLSVNNVYLSEHVTQIRELEHLAQFNGH